MSEDARARPRRTLRVCRSAMPSESRRFPWVLGWLMVIAVLAVFGILLVRTQGAQELLEDRLARRTGMDVSVSAVRIGWPYDLVFVGLVMSDPDRPVSMSTSPLLELNELRYGWRGWRGAAIMARHGKVTVCTGDDGRPEPLRWSALADVEDASAMSDWLMNMFDPSVRFQAEQIGIAWLGPEGQPLMTVENLQWLSVPLRVPRRSWRYFELSADRLMRVGAGGVVSGLRYEWLMSGETTLIELGHRVAEDRALAPPPGKYEPQLNFERENN